MPASEVTSLIPQRLPGEGSSAALPPVMPDERRPGEAGGSVAPSSDLPPVAADDKTVISKRPPQAEALPRPSPPQQPGLALVGRPIRGWVASSR
jgi:hypothetical protein